MKIERECPCSAFEQRAADDEATGVRIAVVELETRHRCAGRAIPGKVAADMEVGHGRTCTSGRNRCAGIERHTAPDGPAPSEGGSIGDGDGTARSERALHEQRPTVYQSRAGVGILRRQDQGGGRAGLDNTRDIRPDYRAHVARAMPGTRVRNGAGIIQAAARDPKGSEIDTAFSIGEDHPPGTSDPPRHRERAGDVTVCLDLKGRASQSDMAGKGGIGTAPIICDIPSRHCDRVGNGGRKGRSQATSDDGNRAGAEGRGVVRDQPACGERRTARISVGSRKDQIGASARLRQLAGTCQHRGNGGRANRVDDAGATRKRDGIGARERVTRDAKGDVPHRDGRADGYRSSRVLKNRSVAS